MINEPTLTKLKIISHPKGKIMHALKSTDDTFLNFGEAYFTEIKKNMIKGWKKHLRMTLNLIVPLGTVQFFILNQSNNKNFSFTIGESNYQRLTVPANYWVAFKGIQNNNLILNIADIPHDPNESENLDLNQLWDIKSI